jgi:membrane-bound metal-dependent hydrolase YbcI (DUF457 family)
LPITPFHFGPGLLAKSVASRHFSWAAFVIVQAVIDLETLYYLIQQASPVHRFFHTFLGAALAGALVGVLLLGLKHAIKNYIPHLMRFMADRGPSLRAEISGVGLIVGGLVGGISHPFLDGLMHRDVRPFLPWSEANPFLHVIGLEALHLGCVFLGLIGFAVMSIRLYRESRREG